MSTYPLTIDQIPSPDELCDKIILTREQIDEIAKEQGKLIADDLYKNDVHLLHAICVMNGAMPYYKMLLREIRKAMSIFHFGYQLLIVEDNITIGSYGNSVVRSGKTKIYKDLQFSIRGRHILIVEDIADTGISLWDLIETMRLKRPRRQIRVAVMIRRDGCRKILKNGLFVGHIYYGKEFLGGCGLDLGQLCRECDEVFTIKEEYTSKEFLNQLEKLLNLE